MTIKNAVFSFSSAKISQIQNKEGLPEFAFIGRSNVGKSSLINMFTDRPLAKVSGTPGKTKLINHFLIDDNWFLVDLPGYGYARVSKSSREKFTKLITDYVTKWENMFFLFVLVDSRHEPQKIDLEFMEMLGEQGVPFGIVFTKADKLSQREVGRNLEIYKKKLLEKWEELPPVFITSSEKNTGKDEILDFIGNCLNNC